MHGMQQANQTSLVACLGRDWGFHEPVVDRRSMSASGNRQLINVCGLIIIQGLIPPPPLFPPVPIYACLPDAY